MTSSQCKLKAHNKFFSFFVLTDLFKRDLFALGMCTLVGCTTVCLVLFSCMIWYPIRLRGGGHSLDRGNRETGKEIYLHYKSFGGFA